MPDNNDMRINIRADSSSVQSQANAAKGAVKSLSASVQSDAATMAEGFAKLNATMLAVNTTLQQTLDHTRRAADAAHGLKSYADMAFYVGLAKAAFEGLAAVTGGVISAVSAVNYAHDAAVSSVLRYAGSLGYATNAVYNLRVANTTLAGSTIGVPERWAESLGEWANGWWGVSRATDQALVRTAAMNETLKNLDRTAKAGGLNTASDALSHYVTELEQIPGVTERVGASIEAVFLKIPQSSARMNEALVKLTTNLAKTPEEAASWAQAMASAMSNPGANGDALLSRLGPQTTAEYGKQLAAANAVNATAHAQATLLQAVVAHIQQSVQGERTLLANQEKSAAQWGIVGRSAHSVADTYRNIVGSSEVHTAQLRATVEAADDLKKAIDKIADGMVTGSVSARTYAAALQTLLSTTVPGIKGSKADSADTEANTKNIILLRAQIKGAVTDADELTRTLEGVNSAGFTKPYFDKSADPKKSHWAVGYGQHSVGGQEVTKDSQFYELAILEDYKNRLKDILLKLATELGDAWNKLSGATKASLASVTYNYGHTPDTVLSAAKTGDNTAVADAILALQNQGGGNNKERRQKEYANIMAAEKPLSPADKEYAESTMKDLATKNLHSSDKDDSGTLVEQKKFEQLGDKTDDDDKEDALSGAQAIAEEAQKDLDRAKAAGANEDEINKRTTILNQAKVDAKTKEKELEDAKLNAAIAAAKDDPEKLKNAKVAKATATMGRYEEETPQYVAAEQEKKDAEREFADYKKKLSSDAENVSYQNALNGLAERKQVLEEEAATGKITKQQMFAGEQLVETDRTSLEKEHWGKLKTIWGEGRDQYREASKRLSEIDAAEQVNREKITKASNASIYQDYLHVTQSIANTMSSSIMGMIQGTSSLREMERQVALDIIKMWLDASLKMVATWSAQEAQKVVLAVTGEQTITAATVAGVAQRTAANAAGAAADLATKAASVIKSILASAAETFAGVFGFLSPIMGPMAIGPASGAMATVSAAAGAVSRDVGAWEIPRDQLTVLHTGEAVMTASQGATFRAAMNTFSSSGGQPATKPSSGGGGSPTFVIKAQDSSDVRSYLSRNSRNLTRALDQSVRDGNHLGLRRLTGV